MIDTAATVSPVLTVVEFDEVHLDSALAAVEKFNRRAARAGIAEQFTVAHSTTYVPAADEVVLGLPGGGENVTTFVVMGAPLVREGFTFVAVLSFDVEAGVVTRPIPGAPEVDLSQYRSLQVPVCDACGTRRQRKDVYVLLSDAGELSVVGSNCLAAYIGLDVSAALRFIGEEYTAKLEESFGFTGGEYRFASDTVLAVASAAIAAYGWVARSAYSGVPTVYVVHDVLYPLPTHGATRKVAEERRAAVAAKLDEAGGPSRALARANEVLAWVRAGEVGTSEYARNLESILSAPSVSSRNLSLAVSAVSAWSKAQDRAIETAARQERAANSEWVGTVGEKLTATVTLVQQPRFISSDWGVSTLLVFADADGNVVKWFASGSKDIKVGTRFELVAKIKKHEEYNGAKSTVVTRPKMTELPA